MHAIKKQAVHGRGDTTEEGEVDPFASILLRGLSPILGSRLSALGSQFVPHPQRRMSSALGLSWGWRWD